MRKFLFTCGDVNGIGPEIVIKTLNAIIPSNPDHKYIFAIPSNAFNYIISLISPQFKYSSGNDLSDPSFVSIITLPDVPLTPGKPSRESGKTAYEAILLSADLANNKDVDAVITAPISKLALNLADIHFPGHTEIYAASSHVRDFAMMFLSETMNAALATIHIPLKDVPCSITTSLLQKLIPLLYNTLKVDLNITAPRLAILGLNPHAGEDGIIGNEELNIISPAVNNYKYLDGPFSTDAFFANHLYKDYDLTIGLYHDQVLVPFKMLNFSSGVNYTAGLPIIRTSPDHGTAFDIAYKLIADSNSMLSAYYYAERIVSNRLKHAEKQSV
jgi:4-hydroxythreonine-4-phosphate dehydrogenase